MKTITNVIYNTVAKKLGVKPSYIKAVFESYFKVCKNELLQTKSDEFVHQNFQFTVPYLGHIYLKRKVSKIINEKNGKQKD